MKGSVICLLIAYVCTVAYFEGWATNGYIAGFAIMFLFGSICLEIEEQTSRIIKAHREEILGQTQTITNEIIEVKRG